MAEPATPGPQRRAHLLATLGELIARNGAADFLCAPVQPGKAAFPEPWRATRGGVHAVLRRLAWYADFDEHAIVIEDKRLGGRMPTQHFQETHVALREVRRKELVFELELIGDDDVAGTLAHELGVAFAARNRPEKPDPYRSADPPSIAVDPERDAERGSIATVYLGLGVLAANAAYQQCSSTKHTDGFPRLIHEVLRGGYVKMSDLAYLLAVQAIVRGEPRPPAGLQPPQRDETGAWIEALATERGALCEQLGVDPAEGGTARGAVQPFTDVDLDEDPERTAFRWHTHRAGVGMIVGTVAGVAVAGMLAVPSSGLLPLVFGGGIAGILTGRKIITTRCSGCATVIARDADVCRRCKAVLRGDIARLADRLEAEERLLRPARKATEAEAEVDDATAEKDAAEKDAAEKDAVKDAAVNDAAVKDAVKDAAVNDAAVKDAAVNDAAEQDAAVNDAAVKDAAVKDAAVKDAAVNDAAVNDAAEKRAAEKPAAEGQEGLTPQQRHPTRSEPPPDHDS